MYEERAGEIVSTSVSATCPDAVVDTTGAGDSFLSGFLYGVVNGFSLADCARIGATVSSFIIEAAGCLTNVPDEKAMLERLRTRRDDT